MQTIMSRSVVVSDPNVNLIYHGYLRRIQRAKGFLKEPDWPSNKVHLMEMATNGGKSADDEEDENVGKCSLNTNFSTNHIEKAMLVVREFYQKDSNKRLNTFQADKLQKNYDEKIKALLSARHEVLIFQKIYSGLPDQNMSISQQALENEQFDIEQLYERFKKYYTWDGKQLLLNMALKSATF